MVWVTCLMASPRGPRDCSSTSQACCAPRGVLPLQTVDVPQGLGQRVQHLVLQDAQLLAVLADFLVQGLDLVVAHGRDRARRLGPEKPRHGHAHALQEPLGPFAQGGRLGLLDLGRGHGLLRVQAGRLGLVLCAFAHHALEQAIELLQVLGPVHPLAALDEPEAPLLALHLTDQGQQVVARDPLEILAQGFGHELRVGHAALEGLGPLAAHLAEIEAETVNLAVAQGVEGLGHVLGVVLHGAGGLGRALGEPARHRAQHAVPQVRSLLARETPGR